MAAQTQSPQTTAGTFEETIAYLAVWGAYAVQESDRVARSLPPFITRDDSPWLTFLDQIIDTAVQQLATPSSEPASPGSPRNEARRLAQKLGDIIPGPDRHKIAAALAVEVVALNELARIAASVERYPQAAFTLMRKGHHLRACHDGWKQRFLSPNHRGSATEKLQQYTQACGVPVSGKTTDTVFVLLSSGISEVEPNRFHADRVRKTGDVFGGLHNAALQTSIIKFAESKLREDHLGKHREMFHDNASGHELAAAASLLVGQATSPAEPDYESSAAQLTRRLASRLPGAGNASQTAEQSAALLVIQVAAIQCIIDGPGRNVGLDISDQELERLVGTWSSELTGSRTSRTPSTIVQVLKRAAEQSGEQFSPALTQDVTRQVSTYLGVPGLNATITLDFR